MLLEYISKALEKSYYKQLEDNSWFGEIEGFQGVWANANNIEVCRKELIEVLEGWIIVRLRKNLKIPSLKGVDLNLKKVA